MTTEYEVIPDADPCHRDRQTIIEHVVLPWEGACLQGRLEAATAMNRMTYPHQLFEYIREHHSNRLPLFLQRCGWREKVEVEEPVAPPLELRQGMWVEHPDYGIMYRVLGWRENGATMGVMHPSRSESGDHVHLMPVNEPRTTYGSLYWVREECKEISVKVEKIVEAAGANTPPFREDFADHVDWVWDRGTIRAMQIRDEFADVYEDGTLVRLWYNDSRAFTCEAWGRLPEADHRSWYWTRNRDDARPW